MTAWGVTQTTRFRAAVMGAAPSDWGMMVAESDLPTFEMSLGGSAGWEARARIGTTSCRRSRTHTA
jgi:dipeptidyl aminopeptidase/acylaminoacyl peptidase